MNYTPKRPALDPCPVETVVSLVGGKWKARILLELSLEPATFGALRRRLGKISQQVLSAQLQALEVNGIVSRTKVGADPSAGSRYDLTQEGQSLIPVLDGLAAWGLERLQRNGMTWMRPQTVRSAEAAAA